MSIVIQLTCSPHFLLNRIMDHVGNRTNGSILFFGIVVLVVLFFIKFFNLSYPVSITNQPVSELSVVGEGKVDVIPDTANVSVGITSQGATVAEVQKNMNEVNNKIVAGVTKLGINKKDITTSGYSINPSYDYTRGQSITGYAGNATVTVKTKDTSLLPNIITAATEAGANQVNGTNYSIDNPDKYREEARNEAITNAKSQAQKLADQLGIRLGKVTNIIESSGGNQYPVPMMEKSLSVYGGGANAVQPDLQPGSQTITSTVTLFFEKR